MAWLKQAGAALRRLETRAVLLAFVAAPGIAHAQVEMLAPPALVAAVGPDAGLGTAFAPGPGDRDRALDCMSMAIAYEAAGQPIAGQEAVGQVIVNRWRDPRFPKTVCGVVFQGSTRPTGCQFTFTCDGSVRRRLDQPTLSLARGIAETVLNGVAPDRVAGATHYHADYVLPYWAASGRRVVQIGAHKFYRMPGDVLRAVAAVTLTQPEPVLAALQPGGRGQVAAPGNALAQVEPAAVHARFAPWGLAMGGPDRH